MATLTAGHDPTALDSYLTTLAGQVYSIDEQCRIKKDNSSSFFCRVRQLKAHDLRYFLKIVL